MQGTRRFLTRACIICMITLVYVHVFSCLCSSTHIIHFHRFCLKLLDVTKLHSSLYSSVTKMQSSFVSLNEIRTPHVCISLSPPLSLSFSFYNFYSLSAVHICEMIVRNCSQAFLAVLGLFVRRKGLARNFSSR